MSENPTRIHVFEHPLYDRLEYELRALLEVIASPPEELVLLNFVSPRDNAAAQVLMIYDPRTRNLKRLIRPPGAARDVPSRLEMWHDVGPEEIRILVQALFLEKTRPPTLEPEVFLGALEGLIERGGF